MSIREYKMWRYMAICGLISWFVIPFVNIKFFLLELLGAFIFLFSSGFLWGFIKDSYVIYRLGYVISLLITIFLGIFWNLISLAYLVVFSILMMAALVFAMSYIERVPSTKK